MNNLPTRAEYVKTSYTHTPIIETKEWSDPKYICPLCGDGGMCKNLRVVFASNPPRYKYKCNECGHIDYHTS